MSHQEHQQQQQHHLVEQIWRDKLRIQGFEPPPPPLVGIEEEKSSALPVYETAGNMLSEMFNFPSGVAATAATSMELLDHPVQPNYRANRPPGNSNEWYSNRQGVVGGSGQLGESKSHTNRDSLAQQHHHHQLPSINADDSASAMHIFLMNPQPRSSPSPPPPATSSNTIHMLPPNPSTSLQGFNLSGPGGVFWVPDSSSPEGGNTGSQLNNPSEIGGVVEGQGLSLSLSSSLQHLNAAKAEELRMEDGGLLYYNQGGGSGGSAAAAQLQYKYLGSHHQPLHFQGGVLGQNHQVHHIGFGSSLGMVNVLRNSKYVNSAQELLEEFCSVGRGQFKKNKFGRNNNNINPSSNPGINGDGAGVSSSSTKDLRPLSAADKTEHQRRKVKLLSILDEVDRRYSHYREQMQMVVNSFDLAMGFGAAVPYTALARKAMSRHFRCLKDAISAQLKHSCVLLGEKDHGTSGAAITKGETPRLRLLEQSLRQQQRAFHQMGLMEPEAWRPQRGLPERSVSILRAWLFEHFLHPYPSDADKHILARQTGLSRNQVSNWFINARVRLWKPMVEEMYQKETKEEERDNKERNPNNSNNAQKSTPSITAGAEEAAAASTPPPPPPPPPSSTTTAGKISEINAKDNDPSLFAINGQCFSENQEKQCTQTTTTTTTIIVTNPPTANTNTITTEMAPAVFQPLTATHDSNMHHKIAGVDDTCRRGSIVAADYGTIPGNPDIGFGSTLIRFGTTAGDVSLTLGLRHAGNMPERDFGSC